MEPLPCPHSDNQFTTWWCCRLSVFLQFKGFHEPLHKDSDGLFILYVKFADTYDGAFRLFHCFHFVLILVHFQRPCRCIPKCSKQSSTNRNRGSSVAQFSSRVTSERTKQEEDKNRNVRTRSTCCDVCNGHTDPCCLLGCFFLCLFPRRRIIMISSTVTMFVMV